jgi:hypothetical protein
MHAHDRTHRCNLLNLMNKILNSAISLRSAHRPCAWAAILQGFRRRFVSGRSRPTCTTPFHSQNRQCQPPTASANDTWEFELYYDV